jgi:hypothetical protein
MATINQSPAGQASVTLSGIGFDDIEASGTPFRQSRKVVGSPSVAVSFGGEVAGSVLAIPAQLLGKNTEVSESSASGMFTLDDHIAAKRAGVWPQS